MFTQITLGERLKNYRKAKNFTQEELAAKINVSGQAVSKWEKGECLSDGYNLKLLARLYRVSIDNLLDVENEGTKKVIETIKIGGAVFEIIEKPKTIFAGKIVYENEKTEIGQALDAFDENRRQLAFNSVVDPILPICDIHLSINFWIHGRHKAASCGLYRFVLQNRDKNHYSDHTACNILLTASGNRPYRHGLLCNTSDDGKNCSRQLRNRIFLQGHTFLTSLETVERSLPSLSAISPKNRFSRKPFSISNLFSKVI